MHQHAVAEDPRAPECQLLNAAATLARDSGLVVHVVAPRQPGFLARAREAGEQLGLRTDADLMPHTLRVRFSR